MGFGDGKVVDIHTHMYPPEYVKILESRTTIPLVRSFPGSSDPRLILLDTEVPILEEAEAAKSRGEAPLNIPGRPLTKHYSSLTQKMLFMETHQIDISVVSLANPWLDFLSEDEAGPIAESINADFSRMCEEKCGRLFFFAALPLTASQEVIISSIAHVAGLPYCRGVILGTSGLGKGLDDPDLLPIFHALADARLMIFLHPHYGLPNEVWGPRATENYGHVLPLALGFPMETTIAVTRMYLAGVFDQVPQLNMLLAHSGGTLPFLAGRIESCILHDGHLHAAGTKPKKTIWEVLSSQIFLDAVVYSDVGLKAAVQASGPEGHERLMFGTDHPFFPPLGSDEEGEWESVTWNGAAVRKAFGGAEDGEESDEGKKVRGVMGGNAVKVLNLRRDGCR